jgi:uncharacterized protein YeaO (DUF488 family)
MNLRLKRIYEDAQPADGYRVLVDRLWPRGVSKTAAAIDCWAKELAPSEGLRQWYGHEPARWAEFRRHYREELAAHTDRIDELTRRAEHGTVTLLFAAKDADHSNALVLKEVIEGNLKHPGESHEGTR